MPNTLKHSSLETHCRHSVFQVQGIYGDLGSQWNSGRHAPRCLFMVAASLQTPAEVFERSEPTESTVRRKHRSLKGIVSEAEG